MGLIFILYCEMCKLCKQQKHFWIEIIKNIDITCNELFYRCNQLFGRWQVLFINHKNSQIFANKYSTLWVEAISELVQSGWSERINCRLEGKSVVVPAAMKKLQFLLDNTLPLTNIPAAADVDLKVPHTHFKSSIHSHQLLL